VVVVVRPERISLRRLDMPPAAMTATTNVFEGVVRSLTYLGPIDRAEIEVAGQPVLVTLPAAVSRALAPGVAVQVLFDAASCHVIASGDVAFGPGGQLREQEEV
jgi:ABC-type Fe3+/spermidine/putrescine transport system ATPase subunit